MDGIITEAETTTTIIYTYKANTINVSNYLSGVSGGSAVPSESQVSLYSAIANIHKLDSFGLLPLNWNGYGAPSFSEGFIRKVKNIMLSLSKSPKVFPTGRNSIQLEYGNPNSDY